MAQAIIAASTATSSPTFGVDSFDRDGVERVERERQREHRGDRVEPAGHLVARHDQPAQQDLREHERGHELNRLELGARRRCEQAERRAEHRVATASRTIRLADPPASRPRTRREADATSACTRRSRTRCRSPAGRAWRAASSSGAQRPEVRSRSIAIDVTRNIVMNGNIPSIWRRRSNSGADISLSRKSSAGRSAARDRAGVADLPGARRWPDPASCPPGAGAPPSRARRCARAAPGVVSATARPRASAAGGCSAPLVHHVAGDQQRRALSARRWKRSQGRGGAGSRPTVGSSSTSMSGRPSRARERARSAGPGQAADDARSRVRGRPPRPRDAPGAADTRAKCAGSRAP